MYKINYLVKIKNGDNMDKYIIIVIIVILLISIKKDRRKNLKQKKIRKNINTRQYIREENKELLNENINKLDDTLNFNDNNKQKESNTLTQNQLNYREYLKTEHWKETREKALKRAGYKCQVCGYDKNLQVHHNTYKNIGHEDPTDLVVLCWKCHKTFHGK